MKSFRSKASRFFRHSPSADEKTAMNDHSEPVFNAGIDADTDPVLDDIDPTIDAAIDTAVRAGINAQSKKLNWFFGTGDEKPEKPLPAPPVGVTTPSSPSRSQSGTTGHPPVDDFDRLPEYDDDSDEDITALPQPLSSTLRHNRADSTLARAIESNDPDVPLPLLPRLRRKDNALGQSNEANGTDTPPTPPPKPEPNHFKGPTYSLFPKISQNYANSSTYSLFPKNGRDSANGSTVGLLSEYNRIETPQFLSATPEPSRTKGGFSGLARLKKSYANLKSKSSQFFKKENVPSPPPRPPPPQIPIDVAMDILYGPSKEMPFSKSAKKKATKPSPKAAVKPPIKSPGTPRLTRPSSAVPTSKTIAQVRTLGISRPKPLPSSPNLFNHPNFSVPTVIASRPRTAVSIAPPRPSRPQPFDHDTVSFMQEPATRMHLVRQRSDDGSIGRAARDPMHTIESRLGLPVGFAPPPPRESQFLDSRLAAQVPEHTSLRISSGLGMPFRYSQFEDKGKERTSVQGKGKGKERASDVAVENERDGIGVKDKERASVGSQEEEEEEAAGIGVKKEAAGIEVRNEVTCPCGATNCGSSSTAVASTAVEEEQEDTPPIERYSAEQEGDWVLEKKVSREEGGGMVFRHQGGAFHYVPNV